MNIKLIFRRFSLLFLLLLCVYIGNSQHGGMRFEKNLSWKKIQQKAKKGGKPVFLYCYTTWCLPCRYMSANVFTSDTAGAFFNERFVMVKVQIDTSNGDSRQIKRWYKDAREIKEKYRIGIYPTYLYFDTSGQLVKRGFGALSAEGLIQEAKYMLGRTKTK